MIRRSRLLASTLALALAAFGPAAHAASIASISPAGARLDDQPYRKRTTGR